MLCLFVLFGLTLFVCCRNRNRDGEANRKKKTGFKKRLGVATTVIFWKPMENHKNKASLRKTIFWIRESVTRREGVSTLPRPPKGDIFS